MGSLSLSTCGSRSLPSNKRLHQQREKPARQQKPCNTVRFTAIKPALPKAAPNHRCPLAKPTPQQQLHKSKHAPTRLVLQRPCPRCIGAVATVKKQQTRQQATPQVINMQLRTGLMRGGLQTPMHCNCHNITPCQLCHRCKTPKVMPPKRTNLERPAIRALIAILGSLISILGSQLTPKEALQICSANCSCEHQLP
jgi:hypothetical protein